MLSAVAWSPWPPRQRGGGASGSASSPMVPGGGPNAAEAEPGRLAAGRFDLDDISTEVGHEGGGGGYGEPVGNFEDADAVEGSGHGGRLRLSGWRIVDSGWGRCAGF